MGFFKAPEFKVGLLVVLVSGLIGYMSMLVSEDPSYLGGRSLKLWFTVNDATGLVKNSVVKMAGVNVGVIEDIKLYQGKARIELSVEERLGLTTTAHVRVKSLGFLGDKFVEVKMGNPLDPRLENGDEIASQTDPGSLDAIMEEVGKMSKAMGDIAETFSSATGGDDETSPIGKILANLQTMSQDMKEVVSGNKDRLNNMIQEYEKLAVNLNNLVEDESGAGIQSAVSRVADGLQNIEKSMRDLEEITGKINRGEGTIGRLINDDTTIEEVNSAVKNVNNLLGAAKKLETSFDVHSEYLTDNAATKSFFGIKIQPGLDRYYEVALVDDPNGVVKTVDESVTTGGSTTQTTTVTTFRNDIKLTALFAKNFYNWTLKGGLIEGAGGLAIDYQAFRKKLRFSVEGFDFEDANIRAFARYDFYKGLYIIAGGDDLADSANSSTFLGAGLFLTNDDLKLLLTAFP